MHHRIDAMFDEEAIEGGAVATIGDDQLCACGNRFAAPVAEIIEDDDFSAFAEKLRGDDASDVSCSSSDENAIGHVIGYSSILSRRRVLRGILRVVITSGI